MTMVSISSALMQCVAIFIFLLLLVNFATFHSNANTESDASLMALTVPYVSYNATAGLTVPVCMFQVTNKCKKNTDLPYYGWFDDESMGGPKASTQEACNNRKNNWQTETCPDGDVEMFYDPFWPEKALSLPVIPEPVCKLRVIGGNCEQYPSLNFSEWFVDQEKGGPKATTLLQCQLRKTSWELACSSTVQIKFSGPGQILPKIEEDSSWEFQDIDGAMITLTPKINKAITNKSCFDMTRKPALPATPFVHFCYPSLNIDGHAKAGTSALYYILQHHPNIKVAHSRKEYCRIRGNVKNDSFFRYLYGFAAATKELGANDVLLNGCIVPEAGMELDVLLRGPKALSIYLVRDAADRSWATYSYWCDWNLEPDCPFGGLVKPSIHLRSPEAFHKAVTNNEPKKMLIPNHAELSTLYSRQIDMIETMSSSKQVHVIASEKMKTDLPGVWEDLSKELKSVLNYDIPMHPKLEELSLIRVNKNKNNMMSKLPETAKILSSWWDECEKMSARTSWPYTCANKGYNTAKKFKQVDVQSPVDDAYITLWLHQVHTWFAEDENQTTLSKVKSFILDSKESGFSQLMFDLPWAWTEREAPGDVQIDSWNKKDVMSTACELGLSLHIVITMREFPPWINDDTLYEMGSSGENCNPKFRQTSGPSAAHPEVWKLASEYVKSVSELLVAEYGQCIISISPTFNNEFETRYAQVHRQMRDYSNSSITAYKTWQVDRALSSPRNEVVAPPGFACHEVCDPMLDTNMSQWLGFREEFLSNKYIELCKIVKAGGIGSDGKSYHPDCLLHIGEIFSSTDSLNSNLFFKLAKSEFVDHLVMDSNMALFGAPSSPSIVGILVSAAQVYGKSVHYEAATERILMCDHKGNLVKDKKSLNAEKGLGVSLLFQSGIARGLEAGVHSVGVTNLCVPGAVGNLLSQSSRLEQEDDSIIKQIALMKRASSFRPTAVIFVPYRAFYAYNFVISGSTCNANHQACWHESFDKIPRFGHGLANQRPNTCNVDTAQYSLVNVWDDLRTRHSQVAVIAEPEQLTDDLLQSATERVLLRFPCVMTNDTWHFFEGEAILTLYKDKSSKYLFSEILVDMPGSCPLEN